MILAFSAHVLERLQEHERETGEPVSEQIHQAVAVWCELTTDERQALGLAALRMVAGRRDT